MDYFILAIVSAILLYLVWFGPRVFTKVDRQISAGGPPADTEAGKPEVKIIRLAQNGKYTILAQVNSDHEAAKQALATGDLALLHPNGKIQRTAGDKN